MNKLVFLIAVTVLFSCRKENSEKVNQDEIWADYRLIYNGDADQTYARASFKHEGEFGEALILSSKSEIKVNDKEPALMSGFRWYETIFSGVQSSVNFSYTDLDDNSFQNNISLAPSIEVPDVDSIFNDSTTYLTWVGDEIKTNETIWLVVFDSSITTVPVLQTDTIGNNSIALSTDSLNVLKSDSVTIHFERWFKQDVNSTTAGGKAYGHYISPKKMVKVVKAN